MVLTDPTDLELFEFLNHPKEDYYLVDIYAIDSLAESLDIIEV